MGIRINKVLGYGLNDLKKNDPRINPLGWFGNETSWLEQEELWTKERFLIYYKNHIEWPLYLGEIEKCFKLHNTVIHNEEYGMSNVLCISPPWFKDWSRYDDIIDYLEAGCSPRNKCKVLTYGIWPYVGRFTDLRTHTDADDFAREFWFNLNSAQKVKKKQREAHLLLAEKYAELMGFSDVEVAKRMLVPRVPDEIELLCRWLCLFNNDNTIFELKPMIYTYWS